MQSINAAFYFDTQIIFGQYCTVMKPSQLWEAIFSMLHQIPTAPVCSKSEPYVGLAKVGFAHVDHLCYSHLIFPLKKHASPSTTDYKRQYSLWQKSAACLFPNLSVKAHCSPEDVLTSTICSSSFWLWYCFDRSSFPQYTLRINIPVHLQDSHSSSFTVQDLFPAHDTVCRKYLLRVHFCFLHMTHVKRKKTQIMFNFWLTVTLPELQ